MNDDQLSLLSKTIATHAREISHNRGERRIMPDVAWFSSAGRVGPGPSCATFGDRDFWTGVEPRRRVQ